MELVRFEDLRGRLWEVWEVRIGALPTDGATADPEHRIPRAWLCFDSGTERRRLANYPTSWQAMSPGGLDALCRAAIPARVVSPAGALRPPDERAAPVDRAA